jgi:hypothetical protein
MQFCPYRTSTSSLHFRAFFILVISLGFMQFDPQLIIKLSIVLNFTPNLSQLSPNSLTSFTERSSAMIFVNLIPK